MSIFKSFRLRHEEAVAEAKSKFDQALEEDSGKNEIDLRPLRN